MSVTALAGLHDWICYFKMFRFTSGFIAENGFLQVVHYIRIRASIELSTSCFPADFRGKILLMLLRRSRLRFLLLELVLQQKRSVLH